MGRSRTSWLVVVGTLCLAFAGCSGTDTRLDDPISVDGRADGGAAGNAGNAMAAGGDARAEADPQPPRRGQGPVGRVMDQMEIEAQARKRTAQHYYKQGLKFFKDADFVRAEDMFRRAYDQDPTLSDARKKLGEAMMFLGKRDGEIRTTLEELGEEMRVGQQQQLSETRRLIDEGRDALNNGDTDRALQNLSRARERLVWFEFGEDISQLRAEAQRLFDRARDEKIVTERRDREAREKDATMEADRLEQQSRKEEARRVEQIMRRADDAMQRRDYPHAVQLYERVLALRPQHEAARKVLKEASELSRLQRYQNASETLVLESEKVWEGVELAAIPHAETFRFPDDERDWQAVKLRADSLDAQLSEESFEIQQIRNKLGELRISFDFSAETTLEDAINFIRDYSALNITVDPEIDTQEKTVKMRLSEVRLQEALNLLLANTGLAYTFRENTLYITEPGKAYGSQIFDVYNVTDILNKVRNFPGPSIRVKSNDESDDSGGASPFSFDESDGDGEGELDPESLRELVIESTGGEEVWEEAQSTLEAHQGQLLVNGTRELHLAVRNFLENLREGSDLFVIVEARFIDLVDDFLEDIGVDSRNLGLPPGQAFGTPYGSLNSNRTGGFDQGFQSLGSPSNPSLVMGFDRVAARMQNILDGFAGGLTGTRLASQLTGLTLQATWLDPFQINAILRAAQEERESRIITAPRVTASNRQRVYVSVITQRAYVQDYELVSGGTGLVVQEVADPVISTFQDGVILDVQPVISSDRRYITLDVRPTIAELVNGTIPTVAISLGSITAAAQLVEIDLPEISLQQTFTSVTVPDGGTVLLGGFRGFDEREYESTVPIIGHLPFIKNLFRRQAYLRERRSLYIMITASVVDLRAAERRKYN